MSRALVSARMAPVAVRARLALPAAATLVLAFRAGGYFPADTAVAALVLLAGLLLQVTLAHRPFSGWSMPLGLCAGTLALLASWIIASSLWSDAPSRVLPEFDRTLLYGLLVVLAGIKARRPGDVATALRWTALAIAFVGAAALLSRVAADLFPTSGGIVAERLSFPLTYWNADGILLAIGLVLTVHLSASGQERNAVRIAAAALIPLLAVTLYLTFSRGGIAAAILGLVLYAALAHPRGLLTAALAAAPPTAFAVVRAYDANLLAQPDYTGAAAVSQGHALLATLAAAAVIAAAVRALLLSVDRRVERVALSVTARRRILAGVALVALTAAVSAAIAVDAPARLEQFRHDFGRGGILPATTDLRDRLTQTGSNGRTAAWDVAHRLFEQHPGHGIGAGAYRFAWLRDRPAPPFDLLDAHSLYFETAAELGVPGIVLVVLALLLPIGVALRRLPGPERHAYAAFAAAGLTLLAHAAADWDWEMPALFAWYVGTAGIVLAAAHVRGRQSRSPARLPRILGGLACLVVALTPWLIAGSQRPLDAAQRALSAGDCDTAIDRALTAAGRLGLRPEPFEIIGYCDVRLGRSDLAVAALTAAERREPANWVYVYELALVQAVAGDDPRPAALRARGLNPLDPRTRQLVRAFARARGAAGRRAIAERAAFPVE